MITTPPALPLHSSNTSVLFPRQTNHLTLYLISKSRTFMINNDCLVWCWWCWCRAGGWRRGPGTVTGAPRITVDRSKLRHRPSGGPHPSPASCLDLYTETRCVSLRRSKPWRNALLLTTVINSNCLNNLPL